MMQAILYGSSPLVMFYILGEMDNLADLHNQNPLRFSFPPELNPDALMNAALQLSEAVLKSGGSI